MNGLLISQCSLITSSNHGRGAELHIDRAQVSSRLQRLAMSSSSCTEAGTSCTRQTVAVFVGDSRGYVAAPALIVVKATMRVGRL